MPDSISQVLPAVIAALALLNPANLAGSEPAPEPQPDLHVLESIVGREGAVGDVLTAEFPIENRGTAPLLVEEVRPITAGLEVVYAPERLEPGARDVVRVRRELGLKDVGSGPMYVQMKTNDPEEPETRLVLNVRSAAYVLVEPGYGRWSYVRGEEEAVIRQRLQSTDGEPFGILSAESSQAGLSTRIRPADPDPAEGVERAAAWEIDLVLSPRAPVGAITGGVEVLLDHPKQRRLVIPVSGFVRPVLAIHPPDLRVGEVELTEDVVQSLHLRVFATSPVGIEGVTHDLPGVSSPEVTTVEEGKRYRVDLTFPADLPPGPLKGEVVVKTTSPVDPEYRVPVEVIVR